MDTYDILSHFSDMFVNAQYRDTVSSNVNGEWVEGVPVLSNITIVYPMPMRPEEQDRLPEGMPYRDHLVTWTKSMPTSYNTKIIFEGSTYEITSYSDRGTGLFYRLIIKKLL